MRPRLLKILFLHNVKKINLPYKTNNGIECWSIYKKLVKIVLSFSQFFNSITKWDFHIGCLDYPFMWDFFLSQSIPLLQSLLTGW
jgi:hypothetical protein